MTRYNTRIIERDYAPLEKSDSDLRFGDIDVDAETGIVIQNMLKLETPKNMELLDVRMNGLTVKYKRCWLLLFSTPNGGR